MNEWGRGKDLLEYKKEFCSIMYVSKHFFSCVCDQENISHGVD